MAKIIVTDKMAPNGIEYLRSKGFEVDTPFGISKEELVKIIGSYDAIIVRSATKVKGEVLDKAVNLKVAGRAGNGVDNIDVAECTRRGITVVNTPEGNTNAAAELSVALIFQYSEMSPRLITLLKTRTSEEASSLERNWKERLQVLLALVRLAL